MSNYQQAVEQVDQLDLPEEEITALLVSVYSGTEVADGSGYDDLVTRRDAQADREELQAAGLADSAAEGRNEELPLTEAGAAIHYYYHEAGKDRADTERLLNEDPKQFARQAFEWWYRGDGSGPDER